MTPTTAGLPLRRGPGRPQRLFRGRVVRDRVGLSDFASALDVGSFSYRDALGRTHTLHTFSVWLVKQCAAGTADTRDVREVIYSPDGKVVRRWDRLGRRTSGDSSHLWHTHISFFRDATRAGRDLTPVFRRYLVHIGAIKGPLTWTPRRPGNSPRCTPRCR